MRSYMYMYINSSCMKVLRRREWDPGYLQLETGINHYIELFYSPKNGYVHSCLVCCVMCVCTVCLYANNS